jgi:hypothetical protein
VLCLGVTSYFRDVCYLCVVSNCSITANTLSFKIRKIIIYTSISKDLTHRQPTTVHFMPHLELQMVT